MALDEHGGHATASSDNRGSPDLFEFLPVSRSVDNETMCAADDIFRRGHLLPSKPPPLQQPNWTSGDDLKPLHLFHRRAESLSTIAGGGGSMAVYCRRLRRATSEPVSRRTPAPSARPKWYVLVFGSMRVPEAMEMKDIRSRQQRPRGAPREAVRGPWRLLRSLSCKGLAGDGGGESPGAVPAPLRSF